jgi:deoxycytidylate deaminase
MNPNLNHKYWMEHCDVASKAATCRVKIACVIVRHNVLLGIGYNGSASGDDHCADIGCLLVEKPGENMVIISRTNKTPRGQTAETVVQDEEPQRSNVAEWWRYFFGPKT